MSYVLAPRCSCAPCAAAVAGDPTESPYVTGHLSLRGVWCCVYCGGPSVRLCSWRAVAWCSVRHFAEGVAFEHRLGRLSHYWWVRAWARLRP